MKRHFLTILVIIVAIASFSGCAGAPKSFTRAQPTSSTTWQAFEIQKGIEYNRAWDTVLEILVKTFEIEVAIREEGYIRTGWLYTWSGEYTENYRVRMSIKFTPDRANLQYYPEAQYLQDKKWIVGTDSRLVATIKTDLMGTVGRTTK